MSKIIKSSISIIGVLKLALLMIFLTNLYFLYFNVVHHTIAFIIILLIIVLYSLLSITNLLTGFIKGFFIFFIYTIILNYLLRFTSLSIWPYDFGGILGTESNYVRIPNENELINSIVILIIFVLEIFLVLILINKIFKGLQTKFLKFSAILYNKHKIIFGLLIFILFLQISFSVLFNWKMGSAAWKFGWLNRLLPITFLFFLFAFIQITYWNKFSTKFKKISYFIYFLYIISGIIIGSRSAIFNLISSFFIVLLIIKPNYRFATKKLFITFLLSLIFGGTIWILGTAIRSSNTINTNDLTIIGTLIEVIQRLSASCDSFIAITNNWNDCMNNAKLHDVMSITNIFPQFINTLIPGKIFDIDDLYIPAVYFREGVFGFDNFISNGDVWSGFGWFLVEYGFLGILIFPVFLMLHFLFFRILLNLNDIFLYIAFFYFNWITYDFILHGSFIVSGFYGLINSLLFTILFFVIFKLQVNKIKIR